MASTPGKVFLIGAGPGDPHMLTLRGAQCLAQAEVVLYDYLASPRLLNHAPKSAERICLGRHGTGRLMSQQEICELMVGRATEGKMVARLKGGDPGVFGRLSEEAAALHAAGIAFEVVPGVTAALAAGTYAGVTLTDRDQASCVAFVTGREQSSKQEGGGLDYSALAKFPGTLVFYMGATTAPEWSRALLAGGKSPDTPVAIVRNCSLPTQQTWTCRLDEVAQRLSPGTIRPPVVVIVGPVAVESVLGAWFTSRPLFGKTVLVTRPREQARSMSDRLADLGARVLHQPAIEITAPANWSPVDEAIASLEQYDWLVFSSQNGVEYFLDRLRSKGHDWRKLGGVSIAAIGPATSDALARRDLVADLQPAKYQAESLAEALQPIASGKRFLLIRASRGREVLAESLRQAGAEVQQVVAYESRDVAAPDPPIADALAAGSIDWIMVTSSASARSLVNLFGDNLQQASLVAISPLTGGVLTELGYPPAVVADEYTSEGMITALLDVQPNSA